MNLILSSIRVAAWTTKPETPANRETVSREPGWYFSVVWRYPWRIAYWVKPARWQSCLDIDILFWTVTISATWSCHR